MNQLIKLNNKNSNQKNGQIHIKLAFQSNILKYVERKKKELSGFSILAGKLNSFQDKIIPADSNLISKNTDINFYQSRKLTEPKLSSETDYDFIDRKTPHSFMKRKIKGHKSSLSDWRGLYGQREQIAANKQRSNIFQEKMAVTDRLFYPARKITTPIFSNEQIKRASCQKLAQTTQNKNCQKRIGKKEKQISKNNNFLSDQNFYHLFYRTNTPLFLTDQVSKKRITKYLRQNKHRRHQSMYGFGQSNDGFQDIIFNPNKLMLEQKIDDKFKKLNSGVNKNQKDVNFQALNAHEKSSKTDEPQQKNAKNKDFINPEIQQQQSQNKLFEQKKTKNLSQILDIDLKIQNSKQINLRLFKPRKNKIEKAISNIKSTNSQQILRKVKKSGKKYSIRQTQTNWSTLYSNFRQ